MPTNKIPYETTQLTIIVMNEYWNDCLLEIFFWLNYIENSRQLSRETQSINLYAVYLKRDENSPPWEKVGIFVLKFPNKGLTMLMTGCH
jgi:hypothetical protein